MAQSKGKQVKLDTTSFDKALSSADDTAQKAFETLDEAGKIVKKTTTSDGTPVAIFSFAIPDDTAVGITADVVGKRTNGTGRIYYRRAHLAYREGVGAAALEGGEQSPTSKDGPGNPGYDVAIQLNANSVEVVVTGAAAHNISWTASITMVVAP